MAADGGGAGGGEHGEERRRGELEFAELVAERVVARLGGGVAKTAKQLVDAHEVARILGCRRSWVYEHQMELPLVRLGTGSRPRLRFDRAKVEAMAAIGGDRAPAGLAQPPRPRGPRRYSGRRQVALLEIKGRAP